MKRFMKEIVILLVQLGFFYIFPLFAGPTDGMGMVLIILLSAFALAALLGGISENGIRHLYPAAAAALFIPSVFIYYNESALIHGLWHFIAAEAGLLLGTVIRKLIK